MKNQNIREKIGFLWHTPDLYFHHYKILELLPPKSFEIVVYKEAHLILPLLKQKNYDYTLVTDILAQKIKYQTLVSNHVISKASARFQGQVIENYLPRVMSQTNIRLMYSMASDEWNYALWNQSYDIHLCFGPWQVTRLGFCQSKKFQVGYPRYDDYFTRPFQRDFWFQTLRLNPQKKTIVWLPSQDKHSIVGFAAALAGLSSQYNVVVKTHPMMLEHELALLNQLRELPFTRLITSAMDLLPLFQIADFICADYGGPAFGAIYLDKNLLLLDNPEVDQGLSPLATEKHIRKYIHHLPHGKANSLAQIFEDQAFWENQKPVRAWLRPQYFANCDGQGAARVAEILMNLDYYLTLGE